MSTSQAGLNLSISPVSITRGAATAFGLMGIFFGGHSILYPSAYAVQFGFPASTSITKSADTNPFIPAAGGRAVSTGVMTLSLLYLGYDSAAGVIFMCGSIMGLVDGLCVVKYSSEETKPAAWRKAFEHFGTVSIAGAFGTWMFMNCTN
jgi:hypothetical protein